MKILKKIISCPIFINKLREDLEKIQDNAKITDQPQILKLKEFLSNENEKTIVDLNKL